MKLVAVSIQIHTEGSAIVPSAYARAHCLYILVRSAYLFALWWNKSRRRALMEKLKATFVEPIESSDSSVTYRIRPCVMMSQFNLTAQSGLASETCPIEFVRVIAWCRWCTMRIWSWLHIALSSISRGHPSSGILSEIYRFVRTISVCISSPFTEQPNLLTYCTYMCTIRT